MMAEADATTTTDAAATTPAVVRLALVGCGIISKHHLSAIATLPQPRRVVVTAIVEPNPAVRADAVAKVHACLGGRVPPQAFATLEDALAADPGRALFDAVDIMVPSRGTLHEAVAVEALRGGRHVLLEKPVSVTVASGERIVAAQQKYAPRSVLMVAENSQYWHEVVVAKRMIDAGAIGDIVAVRTKFWESGHPALNEWAADGCYADDSAQCMGPEGYVFDGGLHFIRPLRMWLGKALRVCAVAGKTLQQMRGPSLTNALITFDSGVTAVFEALLAPRAISDQPFFVLQGTLGEIVIDDFDGGARMYTLEGSALKVTDLNEGVPRGDPRVGWCTGYVGEMAAFAAAILDGTPPEATAQEGVEDVRVMMAMMKAAASGQWEEVGSVEPETDMEQLVPLLYGDGVQ